MNRSSFTRDILYTYISQFVVAICGIVILKLFTLYLDQENLGIYLNIRRIAWVIIPVITLNLGMSEAKYIVRSSSNGVKFLFITLLINALLTLILLLIGFLFPKWISSFLFARDDLPGLVIPVIIFIFAYSFHQIVTGYMRGLGDYSKMNFLSVLFWISSVIFIVIARFLTDDNVLFIQYYLQFYALFILLFESIVLVIKNIKIPGKRLWKRELTNKQTFDFIRYGVVRLPSGFLQAAVFFIPSFVATHYISLEAAAEIGLIVSVIRVSQIAVGPLTLLLLPQFAYLKVSKSQSELKEKVQLVGNFSTFFSFLVGITISLFSHEIIYYWFGKSYLHLESSVFIMGFFTSFLLLFITLRSLLDGLFDYPYSTIISTFSFLAMIFVMVSALILKQIGTGILISIIISQIILGLSTLIILIRKSGISMLNNYSILGPVIIFIYGLCVVFLAQVCHGIFANVIYIKLLLIFIITIASILLIGKESIVSGGKYF